jgi:hypothetical protein
MNMRELRTLLNKLPYGYSIETDNNGQLIIYTNMQECNDPSSDALEEFDDCDDDHYPDEVDYSDD